MSTWIFEPGHTEAEFKARHMMVLSQGAGISAETFGALAPDDLRERGSILR
jgi:hypothetical protein